MITSQTIALTLVGTSAALALLFMLHPHVTVSRAGKIVAFVCLLVLPILAMTVGTTQHLEHMQSTGFCLSCHTMEPYGKSLLVDDSTAIPANHFQNNRVPRAQACYTCHTDYAIFGGVRSKIRGVRHMYAQYFKPPAHRIKLYQPFPNANCLHCHAGTRKFEEGATHTADPDTIPAIMSGKLSCTSSGCHDVAHNITGLKDAKFWKESLP
jgi:cytochrome c-type protein NapC